MHVKTRPLPTNLITTPRDHCLKNHLEWWYSKFLWTRPSYRIAKTNAMRFFLQFCEAYGLCKLCKFFNYFLRQITYFYKHCICPPMILKHYFIILYSYLRQCWWLWCKHEAFSILYILEVLWTTLSHQYSVSYYNMLDPLSQRTVTLIIRNVHTVFYWLNRFLKLSQP